MKQNLKIGNVVDDGTGDYLRQGGIKLNSNFDELYYELGDGEVPYSAGAWKTYNSSSGLTLKADWGKSYAINTQTGRVTLELPKGTVNDYNKVIRARDVFATWNVNPVTLKPSAGDTIKGSSQNVEINLQFADLELVYCPPGRWEYIKNKQIDRITSSTLSNVARKEFLVTVQGQRDFLDIFKGVNYNSNNIKVFHRGNILYYGDSFSSESDFGSPGAGSSIVALNGRDIRLKQACNVGDTVVVETFMDGVSQWRSSYTRRQIQVLDSKLTTKTSLDGSYYVADLSTLKSIPFSAFAVDPTEPINPNSLEVKFNGIIQNHAGTAGLPMFVCVGAEATDEQGCILLGGNWEESFTDYVVEDDDEGIPEQLVFDRVFEHGDVINITWFNNDLGTLLEMEDILDTADERYVGQGGVPNITGEVAITDFNNPGWPNVEPVPSYDRPISNASVLFDLIYPVGTIYENAVNPNNPATYMGFGSWKLWGQGRVTVGWNNDTSDGNFAYNNNDKDISGNPSHTAGGTGGELSKEITNAQLPATKTDEKVLISDPNGPIIVGGCQFDPDEQGPVYTKYREAQADTNASHTPPAPLNNIQPFVTVYRWLRIA